ncbi:hypothetical protein [Pseudoxanthomonas indica]|uniref:Uncharacterized protein n=1 Tax=Pseudoxanthomonas indica TaxID=428993 RepID=A0A1T5JFU5_9GAMM|nr:hypothetical protein [Pseudoxanthomonas indica]GGD58326.1 hypothetical protein GCM10007235_33350 [Pseudoxanthomonas indica]SKC50043.1 hypothetical protein SAMN06296058_0755 [Pseudoxanthomonas indica]
MATRNSTGNRLARAFLRLNKATQRALRRTQANFSQANAWLAADGDQNLVRCIVALSIIGFVLGLLAAHVDPLHPLNLSLAGVPNVR